uniref:Monocarboxylate transporter 14 n=1 Tax=Mesocestoides corti TaxID=53468 RepID=A0A5K3EX04_MESCO
MSHPEQVTASSVLANGRRQNGGSECQVMKKEDLSSTTVLESDIVPDCVPQLADGEDSPQQTVYGPLSKEETEQLQLEANEETTKSEDLRLFLQEMRQHVSQQTQLQQQQHQQHHHHSQQIGSATQMCGSAYDHLKGSSAVSHQLQHQTLTRGVGGAQQSGALAAQKRSMLADQDYIMDTAPDGGWGWIVVFSSFVCMILVDGISLCYGLLVAPTCPGNSLQALEKAHPKPLTATSLGILWPSKAREIPVRAGSCVGISEMGEALGTQSRSALMIPGGLLVGIYLLLGPLASALSNQFDFRPVAMAGGVVSTIGLVAAAFSTNVQVLHGTLGIIGGIGFGLIYLPAIATVGHWFKRRRPFAVGLALCGSGVGTVIGGQVLPLLVNWFTWSGTLIVLAAFCLQCLTLIVLFRPLDLHLRIKHYQRVRRQAAWDRERQRNADTRVHEQRVRRRALKIDVESTTKAHAAAIAAAARAQASQARAAKKALKAQKAQQRRVIYRGSIMQRIIEEKRRQRTVSVGSLDGMVITRDNELIAAPLVADRPPILTAASITRISEAVMRKMEARLAGWHDGGTIASGGGGGAGVITDTPTPVRCDSNTSQPPLEVLNADTRTSSPSRKSSGLTSHAALSRLNLVRESLPQLVQDYVQSQASIAVQNYIAKQHSQMLQSSGVGATVGAVHAPGGTTDTTGISPHTRIRSISNATNIYPSGGSSTPQAQKARMLSSHLQSRDLTISNTQSDQDGAAQSSMNGDPNITGPLASPPSPTRNLFIPSTCASECLSLRRTISDASLTSSNRGLLINVPLEIRNEVAELLDGEVRAEVNQRLRREMMRPQYKKDLFFTGSAQQLDHTPISAIPLGGVGNVWTTRDHSNWDVGLTNNASTPNATISNRGLGVDADGHVDAKTSITSAQQKLSVSVVNAASSAAAAAGGKGSGDPADHQSVRVVDYGDDLSITPQPPVAVRKRSCCSSPILTFLEELLAPGLLLSPTFISLLLSNIFTIWGLVIPYFMFPDIAAENNWTPAEAGSLISYIGLANTFGRCIASGSN